MICQCALPPEQPWLYLLMIPNVTVEFLLTDAITLRNDLTGITEWNENWKLRFNTHKCESMHITRKKSPALSTYMTNTPVRIVSEASDFGVITTENLT